MPSGARRLAQVWLVTLLSRSSVLLVALILPRVVPASTAASLLLGLSLIQLCQVVVSTACDASVLTETRVVNLSWTVVGMTLALWAVLAAPARAVGGWPLVVVVVASCSLTCVWGFVRSVGVLGGATIGPYASTLSRDALILALAPVAGIWSLLVAVLGMVTVAWRFRGRTEPVLQHLSWKRDGHLIRVILAQAVVLVSPFAVRALAVHELADAHLVQFEQLNRFGTVLLVLVAGGIGTELQHRWHVIAGSSALSELIRYASAILLVGGVYLTILEAVRLLQPRLLPVEGLDLAVAIAAFSIASCYAVFQRYLLAASLRPAYLATAILGAVGTLAFLWVYWPESVGGLLLAMVVGQGAALLSATAVVVMSRRRRPASRSTVRMDIG